MHYNKDARAINEKNQVFDANPVRSKQWST